MESKELNETQFQNGNKYIKLKNWTLCPLCKKQIPLLLPFWDNYGNVKLLILCQCQQEHSDKKWKDYLFPNQKIHTAERAKIAEEIKKLFINKNSKTPKNIMSLEEYNQKLIDINKKEEKCCRHNTKSSDCLYCVQCEKFFCENCRNIHNELTFDHIFITRELTFFQECPKHKSKKLKIYNLDKYKRYCKLCLKEKLKKKTDKYDKGKSEFEKLKKEIEKTTQEESFNVDNQKEELNHKINKLTFSLSQLKEEIEKLKKELNNLSHGNQEYEELTKELKKLNIETYNDYYNKIKPFLEKQKNAIVKKPEIKERTININNNLLKFVEMCYENFEKSKGFYSSYIIQNLKFMTKLNENREIEKTISRTVFIENTYCQFFQKHVTNNLKCLNIFLIDNGACFACVNKIVILTDKRSQEFEIKNQEITAIAIDKNYLLFGGKQKKKYYVNILDMDSQKKVYLPGHSEEITQIVPCGEFMFSTGSKDKIIHNYYYKDLRIDCKYTIYEDKPISGLIYINNNILLVSSGTKVSYNIIGAPLEKKQYNLHFLDINSMILVNYNNKDYLITSGDDGFVRSFVIEHSEKKFIFASGIFVYFPILKIYNFYEEYIICKLTDGTFKFLEFYPNKTDKQFYLCNLSNLYSLDTKYEIKEIIPFKNKLMCIQKRDEDKQCIDVLFKQTIQREENVNLDQKFNIKEVLFVN